MRREVQLYSIMNPGQHVRVLITMDEEMIKRLRLDCSSQTFDSDLGCGPTFSLVNEILNEAERGLL
jgi:hypothetical protein